MGVRTCLVDAMFLLDNGRAEGALLGVCAALSATSRKRYPDRKAMRDGEAFTTLLGEEMVVLTSGAVRNFFVRCPGADKKRYPDETMPLQDVLYEFVRCTLAHEGQIGKNVEFAKNDAFSIQVTSDRIILGGLLIRQLVVVANYAPENHDEFPEVAAMPPDEIGRQLFGERAGKHKDYLDVRASRIPPPPVT